MPEEQREGDGRFVDNEDPLVVASMIVDADGNREERIKKAVEALKKKPLKPVMVVP